MKIVIVAKTRMRNATCIGALALEDGTSLRLLTSDGFNHPADTPYDIGQQWDVECQPADDPIAPHVEDVLVQRARMEGVIRNMRETILEFEKPWRGSPGSLFGGRLRATSNGSGFISERAGVPARSTGYWLADRALTFDGTRYEYPQQYGVRRLRYVGFGRTLQQVPPDTLLRVSLARWWRPEDADPGLEKRCYLQLSGWFT